MVRIPRVSHADLSAQALDRISIAKGLKRQINELKRELSDVLRELAGDCPVQPGNRRENWNGKLVQCVKVEARVNSEGDDVSWVAECFPLRKDGGVAARGVEYAFVFVQD